MPLKNVSSAKKSPASKTVKNAIFTWEGHDKSGKILRGQISGASVTVIKSLLRRQGIQPSKIKKLSPLSGRSIKSKDIVLFTRQLATMLQAGIPLLQSLDIAIKNSENPRLTHLLTEVRTDIENGTNLSKAFSKHPKFFDKLFCSLVAAGEQAGILDSLLDRLATYYEKMLTIRGKVKSALFYPTSIVFVAILVTAIIMVFVIPQFKEIFSSFGATLPFLTQFTIDVSDWLVNNGLFLLGMIIIFIIGISRLYRQSTNMQNALDRKLLAIPIIGKVLLKSCVARWSRTLSTMLAAGVPLVETLISVGGASGNYVYEKATDAIKNEVSTGSSLSLAMQKQTCFPSMLIQMVSIGEESGQLDHMLNKVADFYEAEVDDAVSALSSLLEPLIMVFLGVVIGGLVIAMYLPIFKMAATV